MANYCGGYGLFGTGTNPGVGQELASLGAMDSYLVKGSSMTFFRFRYNRYTNFAMETVGQKFNNGACFGGHSEITFDRNGDLMYYQYIVIDLPGIYGCRIKRDLCDFSGGCCTNRLTMYPAVKCTPCLNRDRQTFVDVGNNYANCDLPCECAEQVGKAVWLKKNYGACYNPKVDECGTECESSIFCNSEANGDGCCEEECAWAHWTNAIGQFLVQRATLVVCGHQVDMLYSEYLFMWEELSGKAGKRLTEMIGKRKTRKQLIRDAREHQRLYVPLYWYFCLHSGNTLAFCNINQNGVKMHVQWGQLNQAIVVSHPDVEVFRCDTNQRLCNNDLDAWVDTTFIHLDAEERNRFSLADFDQLITQVQFYSEIISKSCQATMSLKFNHPVIEIMWVARRCCNETKNQWFDFSGIDGRDPIASVDFRLNGLQRFGGREGRYYRLVQPYQFHSSIPKSYVYDYSFALYPEEPQPSGSINLSRIESVDLTVCLQDKLGCESVRLIVFARNLQLLRYVNGYCGILFR